MVIAVLLVLTSWIGTWAAAPSSFDPNASFSDVTLREVVHASIGGTSLRVRLTNRFGDAPVRISAASIASARNSTSAATIPGTLKRITFAGASSVTIPPHADIVSDSVALRVAPQSDLLVSLYLDDVTASPTYHHLAYQESFSAPGNRVDDENGTSFSGRYRNWYFLDAVDVSGTSAGGAIVAIGDSITNGQGSTVSGNDRWTDDLSRRLSALPTAKQLAVLNEGVDGNRVLLGSVRFGPSALARFDDDVLAQSGITDLIVLLGINDIQQTPHQYDAAAIEFGLRQLVLRAHARGIGVIGCTITPYGGWLTYEDAGEQTRLAVNNFIRSSGVFDGIADFDAIVRDSRDPHHLSSLYDSGDHLHPNAAAYKAMAAAINMRQLTSP